MSSFEISLTGKRDYSAVYADVFDHFEDTAGEGEFTGSYAKAANHYRVSFKRSPLGLMLGLDHIVYNDKWEASYRRVIDVQEVEGADQTIILPEKPVLGLPHEAHHTPEAVLRSILTTIQTHSAPQWRRESE